MKHSEFTPHGVMTLSNMGGVELMFNKSNDGVYYRFNCGQDNLEKEKIFEAEITYNGEDDNGELIYGFKHKRTFYSLSECMRVNR
jgi:hypothetical protein